MRWAQGRRSTNIEDRRGMSGRTIGVGTGGVGIVVLILYALLGGNPGSLVQGLGGAPIAPEDNDLADFVSVVLADTEDTWHEIFSQMGREYEEPKLVLFSGQVDSACGQASSAVGPFYCPSDHMVYLDLEFYHELADQFGSPGDFAQAYVVAHEVGHHVQNLLGISDRVQGGSQGASSASVRLELQADCLAGIWANHADRSRHVLEEGDVEEALGAANAIGDDTLQRRSQGQVAPDTFTHGTSAQRVHWFRTGLETGRFEACDTFGAASL